MSVSSTQQFQITQQWRQLQFTLPKYGYCQTIITCLFYETVFPALFKFTGCTFWKMWHSHVPHWL